MAEMTDEQIEDRAQLWDILTLRRNTSMLGPEFDRTVAAIVARAARRERMRIVNTIAAEHEIVDGNGLPEMYRSGQHNALYVAERIALNPEGVDD